jgi:hypothetical protein
MQAENAVIFEGATADEYETTLSIVDPTADHTQYLINQGGYIPLLAAATTTAITSTPAELNILDGGTSATSTTLADADRLVINDNGTMVQVALTDLETYMETSLDTLANVTSVGTLTTLTVDNVIINGTTIGHTSDTDLLTLTSGNLAIAGTMSASGAITANLTGNASGTAATVTTAAQTNITSLGTLTTLTVDNVIINGTTIGHTGDTDLLTVASGALTVAGSIDATNLTISAAQGSDGQVLTSTGSGVGWEETGSGGIDWQAVVTSNTTMVSGRGYFVNTTSAQISMTLPSSPSIGDYIHIIDYAGTFDGNNCIVVRATHPIQGAASDLTVATERAGFTLVFVDSTQGWLLTEK